MSTDSTDDTHAQLGERDLLDDLDAGVTRTVVRPPTPDTARREVAL